MKGKVFYGMNIAKGFIKIFNINNFFFFFPLLIMYYV